MIRWATPQDAPELGRVMFAAIREGSSPYTQLQRTAWMPDVPEGAKWEARVAQQQIVLAQEAGVITGFMSVDALGYIDLAFILPQARGTGVFRTLGTEIEAHARAQGVASLTTHASRMAQPAFQAMGFLVIQHETVQRDGQNLDRAQMEKKLT